MSILLENLLTPVIFCIILAILFFSIWSYKKVPQSEKEKGFLLLSLVVLSTFLLQVILHKGLLPFFHGKETDSFAFLFFKHLVEYTTHFSILMFLAVFIFLLGMATRYQDKRLDLSLLLTRIVIASLSVSMFPAGVSLIISAFSKDLFSILTGVESYLVAAGASLVYISTLLIYEEEKNIRRMLSRSGGMGGGNQPNNNLLNRGKPASSPSSVGSQTTLPLK